MKTPGFYSAGRVSNGLVSRTALAKNFFREGRNTV